MLEIIFSQILKMSLTAGVCIVVVSMPSSGISQNSAEISVCTVDCGGIFVWSVRCRSVHQWD